MIADCSQPKSAYDANHQKYGAKVQLMALNGDSHISEEESGMFVGFAILGVIVFALMIKTSFVFLGDLNDYSL